MGLLDDVFGSKGSDRSHNPEKEFCGKCQHLKEYHNVSCTYCGHCMYFQGSDQFQDY